MSVHQGFPFLPLAESSSAPLHVCSFATDMCGWMNDPNSWRHKWRIVTDKSASIADQALCLSPLSVAESWIAGAGQRLPWSRRPMSTSREFSTSDESIQARLWSPPVLRDDALRSFTGSDPLQCIVSHPSQSECRWNADPNDWGTHRWRVQSVGLPGEPQRLLCLHRPKSVRSDVALIARLWSPSVGAESIDEVTSTTHASPSSALPQCISLSYRIFSLSNPSTIEWVQTSSENHMSSVQVTPTLAILRRQRG
ncbi:hypothetical protein AHF37_01654 [Paragonimus kellicotti]|nr:hypothetical protein AHF37_01654 [Paragonimus kellicotti]